MRIKTKYLSGATGEFAEVSVVGTDVTHSLGILDRNERISLASNLLAAVSDLVASSFDSEDEYMEFIKSYA